MSSSAETREYYPKIIASKAETREYYSKILKIDSNATPAAIKQAYRAHLLAIPDMKVADRRKQFKNISKAYVTLSAPSQRTAYAEELNDDYSPPSGEDYFFLTDEEREWEGLSPLLVNLFSAQEELLIKGKNDRVALTVLFDRIESLADKVREEFFKCHNNYAAELTTYNRRLAKGKQVSTLQDCLARQDYQDLLMMTKDVLDLTKEKLSIDDFRDKYSSMNNRILWSLVAGVIAAAAVYFAAVTCDYSTAYAAVGVVVAGVSFWGIGKNRAEKTADAIENCIARPSPAVGVA